MVPRKLDVQLLRLADALGDAVLFSQGAFIIGCNDAACALLGYSRAELTGLERKTLAPGEPAEQEWSRQREATSGFLVRQGGERINVMMTSVMLPGSEGEAVVCSVFHDLADRRRADEATAALKESNALLSALNDAAFEAIIVHRDGVIITANRAADLAARVGQGELAGRKLVDFIPPEFVPLVLKRVAEQDETPYSSFARRGDGSSYPVEVQVRTGPVSLNGSPARVVALRDISERVALEEQVRHAQKMEAVGQLAGGVAHDFNNLLTVIMSSAALATAQLSPGHPCREDLEEILRASERAASLIRQLLAFSRKQVLQLGVVEVDEIVGRLESMIRRLIGEDLELHVLRGAPGHCVKADSDQLENMVMNLVVNARDAMRAGGRLTISTSREVCDQVWARSRLDMRAGPYVVLTVADTGAGMDAATKARIFEPFFTTKGPGKGTGLGLSTVFGIVKQAGGCISVESAPGRGASFSIYLPVTDEARTPQTAASPASPPAPRGKTILLVEDEPQLRRVAATALRQAGFEVLDAGDGNEALARSGQHAGAIDLLLTDVVMPGMNGRQVADALLAQRPSTRVLYMSGYPTDGIVTDGVVDEGIHFIPKPFTPATLLARVLEILD